MTHPTKLKEEIERCSQKGLWKQQDIAHAQLSQAKEDFKLFEKMIDECSDHHGIINAEELKIELKKEMMK